MTGDAISLDGRRGMTAMRATEMRRRIAASAARRDEFRSQQADFEIYMGGFRATNWRDAAYKAIYLLELFADSTEGQDPHRHRLITSVSDDLRRLSEPGDDPPEGAPPEGAPPEGAPPEGA
ncbi:MAG: hypothetical protein IT561_04760 [Alphaproteobacteria bacterium]|nr:hypothetical protein [Alphaproteobacteria bacterium]